MLKIAARTSLVTLLLATACAQDPATGGMSKDQARSVAKADGPDYCQIYGWYGDGECDTFCAQRDPDCATDQRTPELGDEPSIALTTSLPMSQALAIAER